MGEIGIFVKSLTVFNKRVLLIKRSNYRSRGKGEWDIPGGGIQFGEDLLDCLRREIMEETGLTVRVDKLLYATTPIVSPNKLVVGLTYLSHADSDTVTFSHEHTDYLWATKQQLRELLTEPILHDYEINSVFDLLDFD